MGAKVGVKRYGDKSSEGRTVADGRGQREYIARDDATSPTVSIEAIMISITIDAKEKRAIATANVEGAYLHADMDEVIIMFFEGDMVDYMVQATPKNMAPVFIQRRAERNYCTWNC